MAFNYLNMAMKKFEIYKNIRKRAVIMGLPIALFALMMTAVIAHYYLSSFPLAS